MADTSSTGLTLRSATAADADLIFALIGELADYEKLRHQVTGSAADLAQHLSGNPSVVEAIVAEWNHQPAGFALFFTNYSTFLTKPGLYLEDLYVKSEYRGLGIGKALLSHLAGLVQERGYGRLEWSVLDWNAPAIAFYERMGATVLPDWRICRVTGDAIATLASQAESSPA
ncbi:MULTISPECIES: GNAT family N-acetyltransferase [unclassified Leptolyngbya]|uniref:GNAT family N-acetyltransferase n=1 Tax=unclassified Leptolyngbya TaxID=2650499 RepID=UPI0016889CDC|nr:MULTISPECIES: GNAT family N-acetyltransferase [unclassified Leptolyngbya]MBD1913032.1 GNAT family N-acetyltransferase [Leptolyngbya sp. FACHB-8]MBD2154467.1 GNAT family N-acetyltransferase [Leptolyngbya sp. FACHB-16]